jgi:hypothetical protein
MILTPISTSTSTSPTPQVNNITCFLFIMQRIRPPWTPCLFKQKCALRGVSVARMPYRMLHLAPPFLLDDHIPRYHLLSAIDASEKRSAAYAHLRNCNLCPRLCNINRYEKTGTCLIGAETVKVNVRTVLKRRDDNIFQIPDSRFQIPDSTGNRTTFR